MSFRDRNKKGFSMTSRHPTKDGVGSPGPGRYSVERTQNVTGFHNPPSYSLGYRNLNQKYNENPGPNFYSTEERFGGFHFLSSSRNCPGVKLGVKHKVFNTDKNPGPGSYNEVPHEVTKTAAPSYSITPKAFHWRPQIDKMIQRQRLFEQVLFLLWEKYNKISSKIKLESKTENRTKKERIYSFLVDT